MAYRTPRFSFRHAARDVPSSSLILYDTADSNQSEDLSRLVDEQTERLYTMPGSVAYRATADRIGDADRPTLTRCIIPAGHSLGTHGVWVKAQDASSVSAWTDLAGDDHEGIYHYAYDGGLLDMELNPGTARRYAALLLGPAETTPASLGEWVMSDVWQPETGIVAEWDHPPASRAVAIARMISGRSFTAINGDPVRYFRVEHKGVGGVDFAGYEALFAAVGTHGTFWYDHADSGGYRVLHHDFASTAGLTAGGATLSLGVGSDGVASQAAALTPTAGVVTLDGDFAAPLDLRGKRLSFDVRIDEVDSGSQPRLEIVLRNASAGREQFYRIGLPASLGSGANWCRYYIDPTVFDTSSGDEALDLGAVDSWRLRMDKPPVSEVRIDKLYTYETSKQARLCRFVSTPRMRQDNAVPMSPLGPTYTISMEIEEVLG